MKPGDHPDFFRLPPPPGRSRESAIVLDAAGRFYNEGVLIDHPGMARAFASWIQRHPDDGRFVLNNRYDWTYFRVEDVPFFVRQVTAEGDQLRLHLFDGTTERLDPATLTVGEDGAFYTRVKDGQLEAKLMPSAQLSLVDLVVEGEGGQPCLEVAGRRYPIVPHGSRRSDR